MITKLQFFCFVIYAIGNEIKFNSFHITLPIFDVAIKITEFSKITRRHCFVSNQAGFIKKQVSFQILYVSYCSVIKKTLYIKNSPSIQHNYIQINKSGNRDLIALRESLNITPLNDQINQIRTFMSWNSSPKYVRNSIIKRLQQKKTAVQKDDESVIKIWIRLPYLGNKGEELVKTCIRKLKRCFKTNVKFVTLYDTKKCAMFCPVKDKNPTHQKSNVIYTIKRSRCGVDYVGKTDRCVITRLNEHSNGSVQPMFQHLQYCEKFLEAMALYQLPDIDTDVSTVNLQAYIDSAVSDNWKIKLGPTLFPRVTLH